MFLKALQLHYLILATFGILIGYLSVLLQYFGMKKILHVIVIISFLPGLLVYLIYFSEKWNPKSLLLPIGEALILIATILLAMAIVSRLLKLKIEWW